MRTFFGILVGLAFAAFFLYTALAQNRTTCEVCVSFQGRRMCEKSSGADRSEAMMQAKYSACAQITGGVTQGIQCNNTEPLSSHCSE